MLEKYRKNFKIDERQLTREELNDYQNKIAIFMNFLNKSIPITFEKKQRAKVMAQVRDKHNKAINETINTMTKYEDVAISFYSSDDYNMRVFTHPNNQDLKTKVEQAENASRNPMYDAYILSLIHI